MGLAPELPGLGAVLQTARLPDRISNKGAESDRGYSDKNRTHSKGSAWPPAGSLSSAAIGRTLAAGRPMGTLASSELAEWEHDPTAFSLVMPLDVFQ